MKGCAVKKHLRAEGEEVLKDMEMSPNTTQTSMETTTEECKEGRK